MKDGNLDGRLLSAAGFVRQGAVFADIGTDHAYLPLFLLTRGKVCRAVCTDIAKGPLSNAVSHAKGTPVFDKMTFLLTPGLDGLSEYGLTDLAVCGMGGELIRDILAAAPWIRDGSVRLILQPMSRQETLRRWLYENGFCVEGEAYSYADGKYYLTLCAGFTGEKRVLSPEEALIGLATPELIASDPAARGYFEKKKRALSRASAGKGEGGDGESEEAELLRALLRTFPGLE